MVGSRLPLTWLTMPTALVIADGSWVTTEVRAALSVGPWQIEEVTNPRAVVDRLEESRVDAVIIDMQVGSAGGMAVVRWIRQATDPALRPRMVLLLDRSADAFLARRAGADASVVKPFDASELRAALTREPAQAEPDDEPLMALVGEEE